MTLPHPQAVWDSLGMRLFPFLLESYRSVQVNPLVAFCTLEQESATAMYKTWGR